MGNLQCILHMETIKNIFVINHGKFSIFVRYDFLHYQKLSTDSLANMLISGLEPNAELSSFCILYTIDFLYLILGGFILLFAMLGSISLCITK